jgi:hypothetical protein
MNIFDKETIDINRIEILNQFPNTHKINFTDKDFDEIIDIFESNKNEFVPHIKISHSDQQLILKELFKTNNIEYGEELPSLGNIKKLYREGKSLFADLGDIPKAVGEFAFKKFRSISPELLTNFRDTGKRALRAIVLLNNPSQKHVMDVHLSERVPAYDGSPILLNEGQTMDEKIVEPAEEIKTLSDKFDSFLSVFKKKDEGTDDLSEIKDQMVKLQEDNKKLSEIVLKQESDNKSYSERFVKLAESTRLEKADAICQSAISDGVPPVVVNKLKSILLSEHGERTIHFSEQIDGKTVEADFSVSEIIKDVFKEYPDKLNMNEESTTDLIKPGNAEDYAKFEEKVSKLMEEKKLSRMDALMLAKRMEVS